MPIDQIIFNKKIFDFLKKEIDKYKRLETGGVLIGYVHKTTIYIDKVSGPGKNAIHEPYYFQADPDYVDMYIDMEVANSRGKMRYLGEWHSHLQIKPQPSETDLISLDEIAESSNDFCVLLIFGAHRLETQNFLTQSISIIKYKGINRFFQPDLNIH